MFIIIIYFNIRRFLWSIKSIEYTLISQMDGAHTLYNENLFWKRKKKKMMSGSTENTVSALVYIKMENKYRLDRFREFEIMSKF